MSDVTPTPVHGVQVTYVDRTGASHRLQATGPFLRCLDHTGRTETDNVAEALAKLAQARTCERFRTAWQRHMLADDKAALPQLRVLPPDLLAYLHDQTRRHVERLDAALGNLPRNKRMRDRWHNTGWRAAPTLAGRYAAAGLEAGVAFLALRRHVEPDEVPAALADPDSVIARSMRKSRKSDRIELLDLGFRSRVTDDFPYEPFDA